MSSPAPVRFEGVRKRFGATEVLRGIDLEVASGECLVLLGPSGCGKTTLLRLLAGLEKADAGRILIGDRAVDDLPPAERDVAMVFQNYALYPHLTAFENVAFPLRARRTPQAQIDRGFGGGAAAGARAAARAPAGRSSPAASSSAWRWRARWCATPPCS